MLNLNNVLGCWQLVVSKEVMSKAWAIVKESKCSISQGLRQAWKDIKNTLSISKTYAEYKANLYIKQNGKMNLHNITGEDVECLMENILEKIAEVKGKTFYHNMSKWFFNKYDDALNYLETKGKYTFIEDNIYCIKI